MVVVFPAPFGPRNPEELASVHLEVEMIDGDEEAEALRQTRSRDDHFVGRGLGRGRHARSCFLPTSLPGAPDSTIERRTRSCADLGGAPSYPSRPRLNA